MATSWVEIAVFENAWNKAQFDRLHSDGIETRIGVAFSIQIIGIQASKPQELKDLFDHCRAMSSQLSKIAAINAPTATCQLKCIPDLKFK